MRRCTAKPAEQSLVFGLIYTPQQYFIAELNVNVGCGVVAYLKKEKQWIKEIIWPNILRRENNDPLTVPGYS